MTSQNMQNWAMRDCASWRAMRRRMRLPSSASILGPSRSALTLAFLLGLALDVFANAPIISGAVTGADGAGVAAVKLTAMPGQAGTEGAEPGVPTLVAFTDENGLYRLEVPENWTGVVIPTKAGLRFDPPRRIYVRLSADAENQDYAASANGALVISGHVTSPDGAGIAEVAIMAVTPWMTDSNIPPIGMPVLTDASGYYELEIPAGFTGRVVPIKQDLNFDPPFCEYQNLQQGAADQDFVGREIQKVVISGQVATPEGQGIPGVRIDAVGVIILGGTEPPGSNPVLTDQDGHYELTVPLGWSGQLVPFKEGLEFDPPFRDCQDLQGDTPDQNFTGRPITMIAISGQVTDPEGQGIEGVQMIADSQGNGVPGTAFGGDFVYTDENGLYELNVPSGWTGQVVPIEDGYLFDPPDRPYQNIQASVGGQDFVGRARQTRVTISGRVATAEGQGIAGVRIAAGPMIPGPLGPTDPTYPCWGTITDENGVYSLPVPFGWSGQVEPFKENFSFDPRFRAYERVVEDQGHQDYVGLASPLATIAGQVTTADGVGLGAVMLIAGAGPDPAGTVSNQPGMAAITDGEGHYNLPVPSGWSGVVTPHKGQFQFDPPQRTYANVTTDTLNQDYTATAPQTVAISGHVKTAEGEPIPGVRIVAAQPRALGDDPLAGPQDPMSIDGPNAWVAITDETGFYSLEEPEGWSGRVAPHKPGYCFDPADRIYDDVTSDQADQDYVGSLNRLTVSGTVVTSDGLALAGVVLTGNHGAGPAVTDANGFYALLAPRDRRFRVIPHKAGYVFDPPSRDYEFVQSDQTDQNYTATRAGNVPTNPVLGLVEDLSGGRAVIQWVDSGQRPRKYYALAWDVYSGDWAKDPASASIWRPFDPPSNSGDLNLGYAGAYVLWISSLFDDGSWLPCLNPQAFVEQSGPPHKPLGVEAENLGGGHVRLHWSPDVFGSWHVQIIAYGVADNAWAVTQGPSGTGYWHFAIYPNADFVNGAADFVMPAEGPYWFFIRSAGWLAPYPESEFATAYVDTRP